MLLWWCGGAVVRWWCGGGCGTKWKAMELGGGVCEPAAMDSDGAGCGAARTGSCAAQRRKDSKGKWRG